MPWVHRGAISARCCWRWVGAENVNGKQRVSIAGIGCRRLDLIKYRINKGNSLYVWAVRDGDGDALNNVPEAPTIALLGVGILALISVCK